MQGCRNMKKIGGAKHFEKPLENHLKKKTQVTELCYFMSRVKTY